VAYREQLPKRRDYEERVMADALANLTAILEPGRKASRPQSHGRESLTAAMAEVLAALGVETSRVPEEITDLNACLEYLLRPSGTMRRRVELAGTWWRETTGVLLGSTQTGQAVALLPAFPSGYRYYDAELGRRVRVNRKTASRLAAEAYCFYRPFPARKLGMVDLLRYIFRSLAGADLALVLGASLLVSLLGLLTPLVNKQIFDSVIPSGSQSGVFPVAGLLLGAAVGSALFGLTRSLLVTRLRDKIVLSVQSAAMARIFSLPAAFFKDYSAGELSSRAMSLSQLCLLLSDTVLTTSLSALFAFVYILQMGSLAPALLLPGLLVLAAMFGFTVLTGFFQQALTRERLRLNAKISGLVFGLLNGLPKIKLAGAEKRAFAQWASAYREFGRLTYSPPLFLRLNNALAGALTLGGTIVLYSFAGSSRIAQSDYIAFNLAYGAISGAVMSLAGVVTTLAGVKPLLDMSKPVFAAVPEIDENKKIVTALSGDLEVSNLVFRYSPDRPPVLDNLSLKVRAGEYLGIVGMSGCGKSTLLRLLLGFEKPEAGAVYYGGMDLATLNARSVRQCLGVVLQNGKLFTGDIFANIVVAAPWSTLEDAWQAARLAGLEDEIRAMPMGLHTLISEGSGNISGGQRQRILIARALVSKAKVLFFDEATSALDNLTQKEIAASLAGLGCTRIVIAHRLSTVKNCDRILVLDRGKVAEEGSYEELMAKRGLFYQFAERQVG
jgi:NHLM bacteriocin system ABC transporter ATP-binding protein